MDIGISDFRTSSVNKYKAAFTAKEDAKLVSLVMANRSILFSTYHRGSLASQARTNIWEQIAKEISALSGYERDVVNVKNRWHYKHKLRHPNNLLNAKRKKLSQQHEANISCPASLEEAEIIIDSTDSGNLDETPSMLKVKEESLNNSAPTASSLVIVSAEPFQLGSLNLEPTPIDNNERLPAEKPEQPEDLDIDRLKIAVLQSKLRKNQAATQAYESEQAKNQMAIQNFETEMAKNQAALRAFEALEKAATSFEPKTMLASLLGNFINSQLR